MIPWDMFDFLVWGAVGNELEEEELEEDFDEEFETD
jgi:hypothetical protein